MVPRSYSGVMYSDSARDSSVAARRRPASSSYRCLIPSSRGSMAPGGLASLHVVLPWHGVAVQQNLRGVGVLAAGHLHGTGDAGGLQPRSHRGNKNSNETKISETGDNKRIAHGRLCCAPPISRDESARGCPCLLIRAQGTRRTSTLAWVPDPALLPCKPACGLPHRECLECMQDIR